MNIIDTAKHCVDQEVAALKNLYDVIQTPEYLDVVTYLSQFNVNDYSKRVIVTGVGKNSNIASKISETMASLGIPSLHLNTAHVPHGDLGFIGPDDAVIHISRSGTTDEMLQVVQLIKQVRPNVGQILVHCNAKRPVSGCDFDLYIGSVVEGDEHGLAPTSSTTALLCILDCISVTVSKINNFGRYDFLKFHPAGALGALLKEEIKNRE